jgi:predicted phosphoribosyltransferase
VVLGLTMGGVPVAHEVAKNLGLPLDVLAVRKVAVPTAPGIAMGAIAEQEAVSLDDHVVRAARATPEEVGTAVEEARAALDRCVRRCRATRPAEPVAGRQVIVVDDGLATGGSAVAASQSLAVRGAGRIVLAVPVAPLEAAHQLQSTVDAIVALHTPRGFGTLDQWYEDFTAVGEDEVLRILAAAARRAAGASPWPSTPRRRRREPVSGLIGVAAGDVTLHGDLLSPADARGLVILAHATADGRARPQTRELAAHLEAVGVATLQLDLLTVAERPWPRNLHDLELLTRRLVAATEDVRDDYPWVAYVGIGATCAAVVSAAEDPVTRIVAVVVLGQPPSQATAGAPRTSPEAALLALPVARATSTRDAQSLRVRDWLLRQAAVAVGRRAEP